MCAERRGSLMPGVQIEISPDYTGSGAPRRPLPCFHDVPQGEGLSLNLCLNEEVRCCLNFAEYSATQNDGLQQHRRLCLAVGYGLGPLSSCSRRRRQQQRPITAVNVFHGLREGHSREIIEGRADVFIGEYCDLRMKKGFRGVVLCADIGGSVKVRYHAINGIQVFRVIVQDYDPSARFLTINQPSRI
jgi:hypothetical protein